jgi:hypothetical protein
MKTQILKSTLAKYGVEIQHYYDRVHYYLDGATSEADLQPLVQSEAARPDLEKDNKLGWYILSKHVHLDRKLELFQLSKSDLANLSKIEGDYKINYVEFSMDFLCPSQEVYDGLTEFFHKHLVSNDKKPYFYLYKNKGEDKSNTVYFNSQKKKKRLVYYPDPKMGRMSSKKMWCLHIEYRVKGISEIAELEIFTSEDLVNFQHEKLWDGLLEFRVRKSQAELGRFFYPGKQPVRQTLCKKGKMEVQKIRHLQKYLSEKPKGIKKAFPKITTGKQIHKLLGNLIDRK